jgi:hypothetical protein
MTLSQELYARCRATLLRCSEFDSYNSLQSVFVTTELEIYQPHLPRVATRDDQVSQTMAYLIRQRLSDNRPVFPLFLAELRNRRYDGDALHDELDQLCVEVERELNKVEIIDIPFVIAAMTRNEATDLIAEAVFENFSVEPAAHTRFQQFRESLEEHGIAAADLPTRYEEHRENWRPHTCQQSTIYEIISDIADFLNQQRSEMPGLPLIRPQFFSSEFFVEDEDTRIETWERLGRSGCVIIVDAVSMFHPMLRRLLSRSEMGSNEQVAILMLSPVNSCVILVNHLIEQEISLQMQRAFARFSKHLDRLCEFGVGDLRAVQRWLFAILPEAADIVQHQKPISSNRSIIRNRMGEPLGMEKVIFGERGGR